MHLCDDLVIVEPVDRNGVRVLAGMRTDKILLTTIANPTLPLIRYEVDDQMTFESRRCACGSAHQLIEDVQGRLDDIFKYAGASVHPHVFRSVLQREAELLEYQVRQTPTGAAIAAIGRLTDANGTCRAIEAALVELGVERPVVELRIVEQLERSAAVDLDQGLIERGQSRASRLDAVVGGQMCS
jgi:phenylacetate-CoA ligase